MGGEPQGVRAISTRGGCCEYTRRPTWVEVAGLRIAYQRAGKGPGLALLHGAFSDCRAWRGQLDGLSDEFTVVAWDAPGCGRSADPPLGFSAGDYADCLAAFITAVGLQRPHVLGLSWGSVLVLELYRLHPTVPRSLLLVSAYAGWAGSLPPEEVDRRVQHALQQATQRTAVPTTFYLGTHQPGWLESAAVPLFVSDRRAAQPPTPAPAPSGRGRWTPAAQVDLPPEEFVSASIPTLLTDAAPHALADEVAAIMSEFHPAGTRVAIGAFAHADYRDVLPTIDTPTLLLYGEADRRSPRSVAEDMRARIAGATLVVMPDTGHLSNLETPDRFNRQVRQFLRGVTR
jgi:pimeloyl-ACP methyl ester carboxylesterase